MLRKQEETMPHYPYLIIGGGMTAGAAIHGIREVDPTGAIGVLGREHHPPYQRPPLSKALWKGAPLHSIWIDVALQGVDLLLGRKVQALDVEHKRVTDSQGEEYTFDKLLLATGGTRGGCPGAAMRSSTIARSTAISACAHWPNRASALR
jgi:3-phenylpropionate/trans-cinnamate dioxygenase ferredoxin reductase component